MWGFGCWQRGTNRISERSRTFASCIWGRCEGYLIKCCRLGGGGGGEAGAGGVGWEQSESQREQAQGDELRADAGRRKAIKRRGEAVIGAGREIGRASCRERV